MTLRTESPSTMDARSSVAAGLPTVLRAIDFPNVLDFPFLNSSCSCWNRSFGFFFALPLSPLRPPLALRLPLPRLCCFLLPRRRARLWYLASFASCVVWFGLFFSLSLVSFRLSVHALVLCCHCGIKLVVIHDCTKCVKNEKVRRWTTRRPSTSRFCSPTSGSSPHPRCPTSSSACTARHERGRIVC